MTNTTFMSLPAQDPRDAEIRKLKQQLRAERSINAIATARIELLEQVNADLGREKGELSKHIVELKRKSLIAHGALEESMKRNRNLKNQLNDHHAESLDHWTEALAFPFPNP